MIKEDKTLFIENFPQSVQSLMPVNLKKLEPYNHATEQMYKFQVVSDEKYRTANYLAQNFYKPISKLIRIE